MRKSTAAAYALSLLSVFCGNAAATSAGGTSAQILKVNLDARSAALGDAYVGIADNTGSLYWNPAGIMQLRQKELGFSYVDLFSELKLMSAAYVHPLQDRRAFGISYAMLDSGEITRTLASNRGLYLGDDGTFKAQSSIIGVSFASQYAASSYAGITIKHVSESIDTASSSGLTFDVGLLYKFLRNRLSLGVSFLNILGNLQLGEESYGMPSNLSAGAGYRYHDCLFCADISKVSDGDVAVHFGAEYVLAKIVALRIGYNGATEAKLTGGFGLKLPNIGFDYAIAQSEYLGYVQKATFSVKFGRKLKKKRKADTQERWNWNMQSF
jgi:long-subunit fatty acid transport protein